jgi:hypothetical protein
MTQIKVFSKTEKREIKFSTRKLALYLQHIYGVIMPSNRFIHLPECVTVLRELMNPDNTITYGDKEKEKQYPKNFFLISEN